MGRLDHGYERAVSELGRLAHISEFGRRLDHPQGPHDIRGILQSTQALQGQLDPSVVEAREPVVVQLDTDRFSLESLFLKYAAQLDSRINSFGIVPDADFCKDG